MNIITGHLLQLAVITDTARFYSLRPVVLASHLLPLTITVTLIGGVLLNIRVLMSVRSFGLLGYS